MAKAKKTKKRKASPAQLTALAKGRKKLSQKRPKTRKVKKRTSEKSVLIIQPKQESTKMAKKKSQKSTTKKSSSGRKRLSGFAGKAKGMLPIVKEVAMAVGGGVAAGVIANKLPIADARIKAAVPVLGGLILASTVGKKNSMVREIGAGMAIIGAIGLLKQFAPNVPMLAGEEEVVYLPPEYAGENIQIGYDDSDNDFMGENISFGEEEEEFVTGANI